MHAIPNLRGKRRYALFVLTLFTLGLKRLPAQSDRSAQLNDSLIVVANIYHRIFAGFGLSKADSTKGEQAIRAAFVRQHQLLPATSQDVWNRILQAQATRDSVLISLVPDGQQRQTVRERLIADRPRSGRWRNPDE